MLGSSPHVQDNSSELKASPVVLFGSTGMIGTTSQDPAADNSIILLYRLYHIMLYNGAQTSRQLQPGTH